MGVKLPRLFISHSSKDNVQAIAFQNWLTVNGWSREDVFIDLHSIGAGERWRETLRKANASCEAVILLATPEALASVECQKELELAKALGKEIVVALLRDLAIDDDGMTSLEKGRALIQQAIDVDPGNLHWRFDLATALSGLGYGHAQKGERERAISSYAASRRELDFLLQQQQRHEPAKQALEQLEVRERELRAAGENTWKK